MMFMKYDHFLLDLIVSSKSGHRISMFQTYITTETTGNNCIIIIHLKDPIVFEDMVYKITI